MSWSKQFDRWDDARMAALEAALDDEYQRPKVIAKRLPFAAGYTPTGLKLMALVNMKRAEMIEVGERRLFRRCQDGSDSSPARSPHRSS